MGSFFGSFILSPKLHPSFANHEVVSSWVNKIVMCPSVLEVSFTPEDQLQWMTCSCNVWTELPSIDPLPRGSHHDVGRRCTSFHTWANFMGSYFFIFLPWRNWSQGQRVDPFSPVHAQHDLLVSVWNSKVTVEDVVYKLNYCRVKSWLCLMLALWLRECYSASEFRLIYKMRKNTHTPMFTIARTRKTRCPLTDEWKKKMWYKYTMEYYSAIKRNETAICNNVNKPRDYHTNWRK